MDIKRLVTGAKLGKQDDFAALVRQLHGPLLASISAMVRDAHLAEELVQESFVDAWLRLAELREAAAFPAWLWTMARNRARQALRRRGRDPLSWDGDMDRHADPRAWALPDRLGRPAAAPGWDSLVGGLKEEQRRLLELRYLAGLSLREIALVLGIGPDLAKSRLHRARRCLARNLPAKGSYTELIMDSIETKKLGAHVLMRLSLAAQAALAAKVVGGQAFGEAELAAIGQVDRGAEFLGRFGTRIELAELIGMLNHVDRYTEMRLVEHLDRIAPAVAEAIKQNMFVFEDIVLFDPVAIRLLVAEADPDILATALAGTTPRVRQHILMALDEPARASLASRVAVSAKGFDLALAAQTAIVHAIMDIERSGRLKVCRPDELGEGQVYITVVA